MGIQKKELSAEIRALAPKLEEQSLSAWEVVGFLYDSGELAEKDLQYIKEVLQEIAERDEVFGYRGLGIFYMATDPEKSREYFKQAADKGCALSMRFYAGGLYEHLAEQYNNLMEQVEDVFIYAAAAAKLGEPVAQECLAVFEAEELSDATPEELWAFDHKVNELLNRVSEGL